MLTTFWLQGRRVRRTRYRRHRWVARDTLVTAASLAALGSLLAARWAVPELLIYAPYPPGSLSPPFSPWLGAALLLLAAPAVFAPGRHAPTEGVRQGEGRGTADYPLCDEEMED